MWHRMQAGDSPPHAQPRPSSPGHILLGASLSNPLAPSVIWDASQSAPCPLASPGPPSFQLLTVSLALTQQMGWDGALQVDVLGPVVVVQCPAHVGV